MTFFNCWLPWSLITSMMMYALMMYSCYSNHVHDYCTSAWPHAWMYSGVVWRRFSLSVSLLDSQPWLAGYSNAGLHIGCAWDKIPENTLVVFLCLAANEQLRQLPAVKSKQAFIFIHLSPDTYLSCLSACWLFPFPSLTQFSVTTNGKLFKFSFAYHSKC